MASWDGKKVSGIRIKDNAPIGVKQARKVMRDEINHVVSHYNEHKNHTDCPAGKSSNLSAKIQNTKEDIIGLSNDWRTVCRTGLSINDIKKLANHKNITVKMHCKKLKNDYVVKETDKVYSFGEEALSR